MVAVIDAFEVLVIWQGLVNWLVHLLIIGFEVITQDFPIVTKNMLEYIAAGDSEESVVFFIQLLKIHVFDRVNGLII